MKRLSSGGDSSDDERDSSGVGAHGPSNATGTLPQSGEKPGDFTVVQAGKKYIVRKMGKSHVMEIAR